MMVQILKSINSFVFFIALICALVGAYQLLIFFGVLFVGIYVAVKS